jgi:hypothetical protein
VPGDYTRLTFDPLRDRAMLREQQGRVHLDADFNELVAIMDRRFRVETRDFAGAAVVPASLPDSFKLTVTGGKFAVEPGRIYVDGLLAENHGTGATVYEPVWGEPGGADPTPLDKQPYLGSEFVVGPLSKDRLFYLDVWHREETWVEDATLLEPALGVDTATAVQTAWMVRSLDVATDATCATDWANDPDWIAATQPSGSLLTSQASGTTQPSDPCAVAVVGGYRGLENRLYRVEIHDGGAAGTATFKWSRDNGAVASPVTEIDTSGPQAVVTVTLLGRDSVLRFNQNDWVELLDDGREFGGVPGIMAQVLQTDPTHNTVTLTSAVPANAIDMTRNPRLRRWDQTGVTGGVVPIPTAPGTAIDLDDGVQVILDLAAATTTMPTPQFNTGDHWVFAARAASASVETLTAVPPFGVRHHYARLGVAHGGVVTNDCRVVFPGECQCDDGCECTACVTPESHASGALTLQAAVDKVGPTGGRVCVAPGRYVLEEPLRVLRARSLTVAGAGSATMITYSGPGRYGILVEDGVEVSLERFALAVAYADEQGTVPTHYGEIAGISSEAISGTVGIALVNTLDARVERCFVLTGFVPGGNLETFFGAADLGIGLAGIAVRTRLIENVVVASTAIGDLTPARSSLTSLELGDGAVPGVDPDALQTHGQAALYHLVEPVPRYLLSADLAITDNLLLALRIGIDFGAATSAYFPAAEYKPAPTIHLAVTRIAENLILGCALAGIVLLGVGAQEVPPAEAEPSQPKTGVYLPPATEACQADAGARQALTELGQGSPQLLGSSLSTGADIGSDAAVVAGNVLYVSGDGIRATADGLVVRDNQFVGSAASSSRFMIGVLLGADRASAGGRASVTGNWIREFGYGGIVTAGPVGSLEIERNRIIETGGTGIATLSAGSAGDVSVIGNTISDLGITTGEGQPVRGIWLTRIEVGRVSGNLIRRLATSNAAGPYCVGVLVAGCETAEVSGNVLTEIGPRREHLHPVQGISAQQVVLLDVRGNEVTLNDSKGTSADIPLHIGPLDDAQVNMQLVMAQTVVKWNIVADLQGAVAAPSSGAAAKAKTAAAPEFVASVHPPRDLGDIGVHGNTLRGDGSSAIVLVEIPSNLLFAENRCRRGPATSTSASVVQLRAGATAIVSNNRVEGSNPNSDEPAIAIGAASYGLYDQPSPACTVLGNIADGEIWVNGSALSDPWAPLNIQV